MRRGKQVDAEEAAAAAAEQQQRLLSSLREMLQRELRQSTARPAAAAAEPQSASEAAQTDSLSRALLSAVPALLDPLLRRSRLLMEHESPYRHNLSTTDLLAASSLPPHWNPLRQPALFALPPGSPAEQPLTLRALLGVSCPLSLLLLPSIRLPHLLPRLQRLVASYPFAAPRQILSALKCDEGERWRLERALSEIQRLLGENPLPTRQVQKHKPWKQRREEALVVGANLKRAARRVQRRRRAAEAEADAEEDEDGEDEDEEGDASMEEGEDEEEGDMDDEEDEKEEESVSRTAPASPAPVAPEYELASLASCPSLAAAKAADDALRRQFAAGDPAELRCLPPMLGLTALHDEGEDAAAAGAAGGAAVDPLWQQSVKPLSEPRLALLLQSPLPAPAPMACADRATFATRWAAITNGLFEEMDWSNVFCAGGAVLACLAAGKGKKNKKDGDSVEAIREELEESGYGKSDVDLFIVGLDAAVATAKLRSIVRFLGQRMFDGDGAAAAAAGAEAGSLSTNMVERLMLSSYSVTLLGGPLWPTVQIVLRCYSSPAEVLLGFDVDCCCVGFDGQRAWANSRGIRALSHRVNVVDLTRRSTTYEQRLIKYAGRGFAVGVANLRRDIDWIFLKEMLLGGALRHARGLTRLLMEDLKHQLSEKSPLESSATRAFTTRFKNEGLTADLADVAYIERPAMEADKAYEESMQEGKERKRKRAETDARNRRIQREQRAEEKAERKAAAAAEAAAAGSSNSAEANEEELSETDVSDAEHEACATLNTRLERMDTIKTCIEYGDYGWVPASGHFSPVVLQALWAASEDPAAPYLEFRMKDGRFVVLCKFAVFLYTGDAGDDAPLPCGLQWLTRNPGQQDAPILESGNGAAAAAATAGSAPAASASASSSSAAAAAPLFTGSFQPLPASVSDWASVSQWHRSHITSGDSFGALLYAISLRRRAFMTQRLCAELREKASAHMRPYVDEQAAAVIADYLGPEDVARLSTEEDGAEQKEQQQSAAVGVASANVAVPATLEYQSTLSSLHGTCSSVALPRAAFPDEVVQRLWQREHKGAASLPTETVDLLYHLTLHVIDQVFACVRLNRQRVAQLGAGTAENLHAYDFTSAFRQLFPLMSRFWPGEHMRRDKSLAYFRQEHLHAAVRILAGPRAHTYSMEHDAVAQLGRCIDIVLRLGMRVAGRALCKENGLPEPPRRAPLRTTERKKQPYIPKHLRKAKEEQAPAQLPAPVRPVSPLAQRQEVLLQPRHVLAAVWRDTNLRPVFDGMLVPALRSEDAPAVAASGSSPFLPLLRLALERSASTAAGGSAAAADALSEAALLRIVSALSPVLGALLPQFFRATRRGLWQLQQAAAVAEPAQDSGAAAAGVGAASSAPASAPLGSAAVLLLPRMCQLLPSTGGPVAAASLCLVSPRVHVRDSVAPSFALAELEAALGELSLNADGAGALPQNEQSRLAQATQQQLAATREGAVFGPLGSSLAQSNFVAVWDPSAEEVAAAVRPLLPQDWFRAQATGVSGPQSDSAPLPPLSAAGWLVYQLQCEAVLLRALRSAGGRALPLSSPAALGRLQRELSLLLPEEQRAALPKPDAELLSTAATGTSASAAASAAAASGSGAASAAASSVGSGDAGREFTGLPWCARKFPSLYRAQIAAADEKWRVAQAAAAAAARALPPPSSSAAAEDPPSTRLRSRKNTEDESAAPTPNKKARVGDAAAADASLPPVAVLPPSASSSLPVALDALSLEPPSAADASDPRIVRGQTLDPLAAGDFVPAEFERRQPEGYKAQSGPLYCTQLDTLLLEQVAGHARASGLLDAEDGLQLDVSSVRDGVLDLLYALEDESTRVVWGAPLAQRRVTAAGTAFAHLWLEMELRRLLQSAQDVMQQRSSKAADGQLPTVADLAEAWTRHHGSQAPFSAFI